MKGRTPNHSGPLILVDVICCIRTKNKRPIEISDVTFACAVVGRLIEINSMECRFLKGKQKCDQNSKD